MAIHFLGSENCFLLSFSYFSSWKTQSCMPVSVDGLMAGGKGSLREENWRSGARFSDCCRRWADSKWKAQLRMKPTLNVGHRVGTEARNGAINEGLNADPWHCLFFKKKKNHPHCLSFSKLFILGLLHSQLNGKWGQENGKAESPEVVSLVQDQTGKYSTVRVDRAQSCQAFCSQLWPLDESLSSVLSQTRTSWPGTSWADLKGKAPHL